MRLFEFVSPNLHKGHDAEYVNESRRQSLPLDALLMGFAVGVTDF